MEKLTRRRYTLEYKQETVRLVTSGRGRESSGHRGADAVELGEGREVWPVARRQERAGKRGAGWRTFVCGRSWRG
jgi:hypothetical protein